MKESNQNSIHKFVSPANKSQPYLSDTNDFKNSLISDRYLHAFLFK